MAFGNNEAHSARCDHLDSHVSQGVMSHPLSSFFCVHVCYITVHLDHHHKSPPHPLMFPAMAIMDPNIELDLIHLYALVADLGDQLSHNRVLANSLQNESIKLKVPSFGFYFQLNPFLSTLISFVGSSSPCRNWLCSSPVLYSISLPHT